MQNMITKTTLICQVTKQAYILIIRSKYVKIKYTKDKTKIFTLSLQEMVVCSCLSTKLEEPLIHFSRSNTNTPLELIILPFFLELSIIFILSKQIYFQHFKPIESIKCLIFMEHLKDKQAQDLDGTLLPTKIIIVQVAL